MSTSLKAFVAGGGVQVSQQALAEALRAGSKAVSTGGGGGSSGVEYVSFSGKSGEITYGREREDLDQTEEFLLDPLSAHLGWVCWVNSKPVARHEWLMHEPANAVGHLDLEDKGPYTRAQDGWQPLIGFGFVSPETGVEYKFSTNSKSGRNAVSDLISEISDRVEAGDPSVPLFRFGREKFQAQGEWNWKPKFDVVEWLEMGEASAMLAGEDPGEDEPEEVIEDAPKPRRTRRT
jgi:hypothetical protein